MSFYLITKCQSVAQDSNTLHPTGGKTKGDARSLYTWALSSHSPASTCGRCNLQYPVSSPEATLSSHHQCVWLHTSPCKVRHKSDMAQVCSREPPTRLANSSLLWPRDSRCAITLSSLRSTLDTQRSRRATQRPRPPQSGPSSCT